MPDTWVEQAFEAEREKAAKAEEKLEQEATSAAAFNSLFSLLKRRMEQDIGAYNQRVGPMNQVEIDSRYLFAAPRGRDRIQPISRLKLVPN